LGFGVGTRSLLRRSLGIELLTDGRIAHWWPQEAFSKGFRSKVLYPQCLCVEVSAVPSQEHNSYAEKHTSRLPNNYQERLNAANLPDRFQSW
jgi:hypothetical protein